MGQKNNPLIFRKNIQKNTSLCFSLGNSNENAELYNISLQIRNLFQHIFEPNGLLIQDIKIFFLYNQLNVRIFFIPLVSLIKTSPKKKKIIIWIKRLCRFVSLDNIKLKKNRYRNFKLKKKKRHLKHFFQIIKKKKTTKIKKKPPIKKKTKRFLKLLKKFKKFKNIYRKALQIFRRRQLNYQILFKQIFEQILIINKGNLDVLHNLTKLNSQVRLTFINLIVFNPKPFFNIRIKKQIAKFYRKETFFNDAIKILNFVKTYPTSAQVLSHFILHQFNNTPRNKHTVILRFFKQMLPLSVFHNDKFSSLLGVKLQIKGRFSRATRSQKNEILSGRLPLQTLKKNIDYSMAQAYSVRGTFSIKVWLFYKNYAFPTKKFDTSQKFFNPKKRFRKFKNNQRIQKIQFNRY